MPEEKKLEKPESKPKAGYGGARPGSGRKMLAGTKELAEIKERLKQHGLVEVDITKGTQLVRMTRIEALMDVLFIEGFTKKNLQAIKEYLDRQLGKSVQPIGGTDDTPPLRIEIVRYGNPEDTAPPISR